MTHDELLARIDEDEKFLEQYFGGKFKGQSALRAVVELHKPEKGTLQSWFKFLHNKPVVGCRLCEDFYPCPTIQAIEKELA
jgi:hypothetical protein